MQCFSSLCMGLLKTCAPGHEERSRRGSAATENLDYREGHARREEDEDLVEYLFTNRHIRRPFPKGRRTTSITAPQNSYLIIRSTVKITI